MEGCEIHTFIFALKVQQILKDNLPKNRYGFSIYILILNVTYRYLPSFNHTFVINH